MAQVLAKIRQDWADQQLEERLVAARRRRDEAAWRERQARLGIL
jgi:hypothetical protein